LLPITGFATWTGWFSFEELDLLVLGAAAGGYAAMAVPFQLPVARRSHGSHFSPVILAMLLLLSVSYGVALYRGISDAGGFSFDWIGNYYSSMNSVRIAKSFAMALLIWPLLKAALHKDEVRTSDLLAGGLILGLGGATFAALWERAAFTSLLNFSSDYRTSALFWEMHVGGAALDGFLALTFPFIVWQLRPNAGPLRVAMAFGLAATATYACLTTFSRAVYIAVPISLATLAILMSARGEVKPLISPRRMTVLAAIAAGAVYLVFRDGGYRSLLAFIATVGVGLWLDKAGITRSRNWAVALLAGLAAGAVAGAVAMSVHKGPYFLFGLVFAWNCGLIFWPADASARQNISVRLIAFGLLLASAGVVSMYWGGTKAFVDSSIALLLATIATIANALSPEPWIGRDFRARAISLGMLSLIAVGVAVFGGGAYMGDRFAISSGDLELRMRHWKDGINMLIARDDWWLGKGLGRFPANYFFHVTDGALPGSFALHGSEGQYYVTLAGPRYPTSWGDLFRIAQRVTPSPGIYTVVLEVRSPLETQLHVELCEQHLLYNGACAVAAATLRGTQEWERISRVLDGRGLSKGTWYAPRLGFFALAVVSMGQAVDIRNVALIAPDGRSLIANGDFANGIARWVPISERYHLPWHIKNLELNLLFDQGITGLTIFLFLLLTTLTRLAFGRARNHPMAPFLVASLVGFIFVGVFDSLLDVPRLAFLFYLLMLTGLGLPALGRTAPPLRSDPSESEPKNRQL